MLMSNSFFTSLKREKLWSDALDAPHSPLAWQYKQLITYNIMWKHSRLRKQRRNQEFIIINKFIQYMNIYLRLWASPIRSVIQSVRCSQIFNFLRLDLKSFWGLGVDTKKTRNRAEVGRKIFYRFTKFLWKVLAT